MVHVEGADMKAELQKRKDQQPQYKNTAEASLAYYKGRVATLTRQGKLLEEAAEKLRLEKAALGAKTKQLQNERERKKLRCAGTASGGTAKRCRCRHSALSHYDSSL